MKLIMLGVAFIATLFGLGTVMAAGDAESGREKSASCMGCHGVPGMKNAYPTYMVPKLGGQHAAYIIAALKAYQTGDRKHSTMRAQVAGMTDQDMADIAAYFAGLKSAN